MLFPVPLRFSLLFLPLVLHGTFAASLSELNLRDHDPDDYRSFSPRDAEADFDDAFDFYALGSRDAEPEFELENEGFLFERDAEPEALVDLDADFDF